MNERIAKLANESGFDVDKTGVFGNYSQMHRLEKFALLIVRDCVENLKFHGHDDAVAQLQWHAINKYGAK